MSKDVSGRKAATKLHLNVNGKIMPEDEQVNFLALLSITIQISIHISKRLAVK